MKLKLFKVLIQNLKEVESLSSLGHFFLQTFSLLKNVNTFKLIKLLLVCSKYQLLSKLKFYYNKFIINRFINLIALSMNGNVL